MKEESSGLGQGLEVCILNLSGTDLLFCRKFISDFVLFRFASLQFKLVELAVFAIFLRSPLYLLSLLGNWPKVVRLLRLSNCFCD